MHINRRIESFNLRKPENSGKYQSSLLRQDEMDALCSNCLQVFLRGFPTVWAASQKFIDFGICSPVKGENGSVWAWNMRVAWERAKATPFGFCLEHCLRQLRNSSPKIYSCYDRQLYSRLQISHKIEKRGGQLQGFINLAKSHGWLVAACSWWDIGKTRQLFVEEGSRD